jgi:hypothetical protein
MIHSTCVNSTLLRSFLVFPLIHLLVLKVVSFLQIPETKSQKLKFNALPLSIESGLFFRLKFLLHTYPIILFFPQLQKLLLEPWSWSITRPEGPHHRSRPFILRLANNRFDTCQVTLQRLFQTWHRKLRQNYILETDTQFWN